MKLNGTITDLFFYACEELKVVVTFNKGVILSVCYPLKLANCKLSI